MEYEEYVVDALGKIGIKATLRPYESGAFYSVVYNQKAYDDMTFLTVWAGGTFGPDIWLNQIYGTGYGSNYSRVSDPKLDPLLKAQMVEMDPVKRKETIDEIQRYLIEQAYYVYGHHSYSVTCLQPWVRNYKTHAASYHYGRIEELIWLTEDAAGRKGG
jgi:ABC-type transport system substrate-binding protein